jgi:hypothetical protein
MTQQHEAPEGGLTMDVMAERRHGDWIQTYTGRQFWPMDPRADEIYIEDVAHALSMACRYAGHCRRFYSVAEHCVLMARQVAPEHRLWALLHDASEAYLTDVPRPVKPFLPGYREAEDRLMGAICERFGLTPGMPAEVKRVDSAILNDERAQNMCHSRFDWSIDPTPLGVTLQFWEPAEAERQFLAAFADPVRLACPAVTPGDAAVPVAYMVDCGNTAIAQGDVRFWRAKRKDEAHGCALAHGKVAVSLYLAPTPPAPSGLVDAVPASDWGGTFDLWNDIETHYEGWRAALVAQKERALETDSGRPEESRGGYEQHEIDVFERTFAFLRSLPPVRATLSGQPSAPPAPATLSGQQGTPPAPSGLVDALKAAREFIATVYRDTGHGERTLRTLDATLLGQQGGAVPVGDDRLAGLDFAADIADHWHQRFLTLRNELPAWGSAAAESRLLCKATGAKQVLDDIRAERARLAEQPAPAGTSPRDFRHRERFKSGVRAAITWLHNRAWKEMRDPAARAILNSAAANLGWDLAADRVPDGALVMPAPAETGADGVEGLADGLARDVAGLLGRTYSTAEHADIQGAVREAVDRHFSALDANSSKEGRS